MLADRFEPFDVDAGPLRLRARPMTDLDLSYVYHSWVLTASDFQEHPPAHTRKAIDILLEDPGTLRLVVADREDPTFIAGFMVSSPSPTHPVLHMAFVKGGFRGHGLARAMLLLTDVSQGRPFGSTFRTKDLERSKRRGWDPVFIPTFAAQGGRAR